MITSVVGYVFAHNSGHPLKPRMLRQMRGLLMKCFMQTGSKPAISTFHATALKRSKRNARRSGSGRSLMRLGR